VAAAAETAAVAAETAAVAAETAAETSDTFVVKFGSTGHLYYGP
jgi:hypothetical protein